MPIRASALILSIVSEQVGKGAMSLYLLRGIKSLVGKLYLPWCFWDLRNISAVDIFESWCLFYYEFLLELINFSTKYFNVDLWSRHVIRPDSLFYF